MTGVASEEMIVRTAVLREGFRDEKCRLQFPIAPRKLKFHRSPGGVAAVLDHIVVGSRLLLTKHGLLLCRSR